MFDFNLRIQRKDIHEVPQFKIAALLRHQRERAEKPQNSDMQVDDQQSDQLLFPDMYLGDHNTVYSKANINAIMKSYDSRKRI